MMKQIYTLPPQAAPGGHHCLRPRPGNRFTTSAPYGLPRHAPTPPGSGPASGHCMLTIPNNEGHSRCFTPIRCIFAKNKQPARPRHTASRATQNTNSMTKKHITAALIAVAALAACGDNGARSEADRLLERANTEFESKQYDKALRTIDSLRRVYPNAIETRKEALKLYQDISLKQAQDDLALTDSALQAVKAAYRQLKDSVEKKRANLTATEDELSTLNLTKVKMDSLQVRFDVQCAKIKYIHKKQKEE